MDSSAHVPEGLYTCGDSRSQTPIAPANSLGLFGFRAGPSRTLVRVLCPHSVSFSAFPFGDAPESCTAGERGVVSHLEILEAELQEFQVELTSHEKTLLARYCDELIRWNKKVNLTGLQGAEMVRRLVVEPVWIGLRLQFSGTLADIGSGNGSPALPLHVCCRLEKLTSSRLERNERRFSATSQVRCNCPTSSCTATGLRK